MNESIYENLPDEPELAFVVLERHFKEQLESDIKGSDEGSAISFFKQRYCNQVIASAKSLDIDHLKDYSAPVGGQNNWEFYDQFETDVMNFVIQIQINHSRRRKKYSVYFDSATKQKIRHYIE